MAELIPLEISGVVTLDGAPVEADLFLVDLTTLPKVTSYAADGTYQFYDPGDNTVIPASGRLMVVCDYGDGVRPLVHGPVSPSVAPGILDPVTDEYIAFTAPLIYFNGDPAPVDARGGFCLTTVGSPVYSNDGLYTGSVTFASTDDAVAINGLDMSYSMLTIEAWVYLTNDFGNGDYEGNTIVSQCYPGSSGEQEFVIRSDGKPRYYKSSASALGGSYYLICTDSVIELNKWHHVALVLDTASARIYVDGKMVVSGEPVTWADTAQNVEIGRCLVSSYPQYAKSMAGSIDSVRITRGVARYTTDFTPRSTPFPNQ
jgi:hypothetical protein